jgi:hypothetical protein
MVCINVQITLRLDFKINQAMTGHLIEHVIKKRDTSLEFSPTVPVKINGDLNLSLQGIAFYRGLACSHGILSAVV